MIPRLAAGAKFVDHPARLRGAGESMEYKLVEVVEVGRLRVEVAIGDITRLPQRVGAVVSFDDARLSACSAVAAAIRKSVGSPEVDRQIAELAGFPDPKGRLRLGMAGSTSPGRLNADAILHAVVYDSNVSLDRDAVHRALYLALGLADDKIFNPVAVPVPDGQDSAAARACQAICNAIIGFADVVHPVETVLLVCRSEDAVSLTKRTLMLTLARRAPPPIVGSFTPPEFSAGSVPLVAAPSSPPTTPSPLPQAEPPPAPGPPPSMPIPEPVKRAHAQQKLVVFVGSGLSLGRDVRGSFPSWKQLPERLLEACRTHDAFLSREAIAAKRATFQSRMSLEQMLSELGTLEAALGRDYQRALNDIFRPRDAAPGAAHRAVIQLGTRAILTTNYDQLLELVPEPDGPHRQVYTWKGSTRALHDLRDGRKILFKVHGSAEDHESVVMSSLEYHRARSDTSYTAVLRYLLQDNLFLFLGYGMNDPMDLDLALRANGADFQSAAQRHYVLLYNPTDGDIDRLSREYNVRVIPYTDHDEIRLFLTALSANG